MKRLRPKEIVHPPVGAIGRDQLERNQSKSSGRNSQPISPNAESRLTIEK